MLRYFTCTHVNHSKFLLFQSTLVQLLALTASSAAAQSSSDPTPPQGEAVTAVAAPNSEDFTFSWTDLSALVEESEPFITLAAFALTLIFGSSAYYLRSQAISLRRQLKSLFAPARPEMDRKINNALVLGLGGSGKTTLIRSITGDTNADPRRKTISFDIYSSVYRTPVENKKDEVELYLADYVGQNLGSLFRGFTLEQHTPYSPMRYGSIRSIILVVDLFPAPETAGSEQNKKSKPDEVRIRENLDEWNRQSLAAVFGLATDTLDYVCLFINKSDLLTKNDNASLSSVFRMYEPLFLMIQDFAHGAIVEYRIGSAGDGQNVQPIREYLVAHSVDELTYEA